MQHQHLQQRQGHVQVPQMYASQLWTTSNNETRPGFHQRTIAGLSMCQIGLGLLAIALGMTAIVIECPLYYIGLGIWCGFFYMISGVVGMTSSSNRTNATLVASMVLSVVSASLFSCVLLSSCALAIHRGRYDHQTQLVVDAVLGTVAFGEAVIAIISSAFCCRAVCCDQSTHRK
ncbi:uncharacterized protein [Ptychodera flava]|uniref:uncharacterized protein n=1 Tax=Ptychodera flava TaxID=63121 RepID=UPI00396A896F